MTSSELISIKVKVPLDGGTLIKRIKIHPDLLDDEGAFAAFFCRDLKKSIQKHDNDQ